MRDDLYGPDPLGARRVVALFEHLPPDAAVWRDMGVSWTTEMELQALGIEMLDAFRRTYIIANSKKGAKQPEPIRIPRPYEKTAPARARGTRLSELIQHMKMPVRVVPGKEA